MNKNDFCKRPPMGWNSYDYFDTTVTEKDVRENAEYIAANLKEYGWEYVVIDIEWYSYDAGTQQPRYQYIPFGRSEMDEYGRLLPCPERFPSSIGGKGFAPLAEYIHSLGLKFGIHIMRGIPRLAAHLHMPILGSTQSANEVAEPNNTCFWNPDMYGLRPNEPGSQEYYNSIFALYAEWGVDFIKCDDICRMDNPSAKEEIRMLHNAIENCGRPIVLSLSPGPAIPTQAWWYEEYANMWRITDDLWDTWELVHAMFERCEVWQNHVSEGCFPDCDMLPFGRLGKGFGHEWNCRLTKEEQKTLMALWCIFRSPLMLGACPVLLDEDTLSLLTNRRLIAMQQEGFGAKQRERDASGALWISENSVTGSCYVACFNFREETAERSLKLKELFPGRSFTEATDIFHDNTQSVGETLSVTMGAHGPAVYELR